MPVITSDQWTHVLWSLALVVIAIIAVASLFTALIVNNEKNIVKLFSPANASPSNVATFSLDPTLAIASQLKFVHIGSPVITLPRQDVTVSVLPSGTLAVENTDSMDRPFFMYINMMNVTGVNTFWIGDGQSVEILKTTNPQVIQGYVDVPASKRYSFFYTPLNTGVKPTGKIEMFIVSFR